MDTTADPNDGAQCPLPGPLEHPRRGRLVIPGEHRCRAQVLVLELHTLVGDLLVRPQLGKQPNSRCWPAGQTSRRADTCKATPCPAAQLRGRGAVRRNADSIIRERKTAASRLGTQGSTRQQHSHDLHGELRVVRPQAHLLHLAEGRLRACELPEAPPMLVQPGRAHRACGGWRLPRRE